MSENPPTLRIGFKLKQNRIRFFVKKSSEVKASSDYSMKEYNKKHSSCQLKITKKTMLFKKKPIDSSP